MKHIVLTGGGTAGHVTPNIALIPRLKELGYEISYIGSYDGIEKKLIEEMNIPYYLKLKIPKDKFFVMGDNRNISLDSRYFGLVQGTDIQGKAIFKYCYKNHKFKFF